MFVLLQYSTAKDCTVKYSKGLYSTVQHSKNALEEEKNEICFFTAIEWTSKRLAEMFKGVSGHYSKKIRQYSSLTYIHQLIK